MNVDVSQLDSFCERWLRKADAHHRYRRSFSRIGRSNSLSHRSVEARDPTAASLADCFDRFTSLYVAYNRVYTEVGKLLIAKDRVRPPRRGRYAPLPDRRSATEYVVNYYGADRLRDEILQDHPCRQAVDTLAQLISEHHFYLHEDYRSGIPDLERDADLARRAADYDVYAVLELIYQARCNLFHGAKSFEERQRAILETMSTILRFVAVKVLAQLKKDLR